MERTLFELARLVGGEVKGNHGIVIKGIAPLDAASEGNITFILANKPEFIKMAEASSASAFIVPPEVKLSDDRNMLVTDNPRLAYARILTLFCEKDYVHRGIDASAAIGSNLSAGTDITIHANAYIGNDVVIGDRAIIYPGVFIGNNCRIGEDIRIYPNAVVMDGSIIGNRVIIHSGAIIGSDGFGYAQEGRKHFKIPQTGIVEIEDDVEVGANTTIDRATFGKTLIRRGVKIDNLVQIAHNVEVGEDNIIVAQAGIAGSTMLGRNVMVLGQVAIKDHLTIGDNVTIIGQSGVASDVGSGQTVTGTPAIPHRKWLRAQHTFSRLPELERRISDLEKKSGTKEEGSDNK